MDHSVPTWTVDDEDVIQKLAKPKAYKLSQSAWWKYRDWRADVQHRNLHPKEAAERNGDMHYEELSGKLKGEFTIRVSQADRVAFTLDTARRVVHVFHLGKHYPA